MSLALLKDVFSAEAFNKEGEKFLGFELDSNTVSEDQFQSNVLFLIATVESGKGIQKIPLVTKFEPSEKKAKTYYNTSVQFYNETLMYEVVLPFLNKSNIIENIFPKFYYGVGSVDELDNNVVVIENLKPSGYKLTDEKCFLDYAHLVLAMEKLGKFHALSYAAKKNSPDAFTTIARRLREVYLIEGDLKGNLRVIPTCFHRAMDPLIKSGSHVQVLQRILARIDNNKGVVEFVKHLVTPEEPMAVICHGDFCRNNVHFKYDENGKPTDVKFFDVATARYANPIVDISFFLFLNSSKKVRRTHFDDLLKSYHAALSSAVPGIEVPSLGDLSKEFRKRGIYGFVHCSFFLPIMLFENPFKKSMPMENLEEMNRIIAKVGGDEATCILSDMVEELVDLGCLSLEHEFLNTSDPTSLT